jgi:hypothetical protein
MLSSNVLRSLRGLLTTSGRRARKWIEGGPRRRPTPQARPALETLEDRAVPAQMLVLGTDGNLWQEAPGWQNYGRTFLNSGVRGFAQGSDGYDYVLGNDGNLWKEQPGWQTKGRTWLNGSVRSFALGSDGYDYVLGNDGKLWKEPPDWQAKGRTFVESNVQSFALDNNGWNYVYVLGTDGNLWQETPGGGRTYVESNLQSFTLGSDGWLYVVGTDGNLWCEGVGWQTYGSRTWIDGPTGHSAVRSFALGSDGYDYVLGTDLNLWREVPGWQTNYNRLLIESNVQKFDLGSDGYEYVLGTDGNLWQEYPGWQRQFLGSNVQGFVASNDGYFLTLGPRPAASAAYSPVNGTLFNPNTNAPSYLDVQQVGAADCWLMASLAAVAARAPADIQNMFLYEGSTVDNGTVVNVYSVRFYNWAGTAEYVTVDTELPGGGGIYDRPTGGALLVDGLPPVNGSPSPVLWAALAEKAYVEANAMNIVTTVNGSSYSYSDLNNGYAVWALGAIADQWSIKNSTDPSAVASAWNAGEFIVLGTNNPKNSGFVSKHAYAVVGYNPSSSYPFEVFNPWGTDANYWAPEGPGTIYGLCWTSNWSISNNFSSESFAVGAAPGERLRKVRHVRTADGLADLASIEELLDPHAKARKRGAVSPASAVSVN